MTYPMIPFRFDERKAAQAAAYLIKRHGGQLNYFRLIKLLYLADRQILLETGITLTGDRMVSMDKGPVLSGIYDLIKQSTPSDGSEWSQLIARSDQYFLSIQVASPPVDDLSDYETEVLEKVDLRFGQLPVKALVALLHALGEWRDPNGSSLPIEPEEILAAEHRSRDQIQRVAEDARELWQLDSMKAFGR